MKTISYLNNQLQRCRKEDAILCDEKAPICHGNFLPGWEQSIKGFTPEVGAKIKKNCESLEPDPLNLGIRGEHINLGGYRFEWDEAGFWKSRRQQCEIRLVPDVSRSDATALLKRLRKVEEKILNRGRATWERPIIRIGAKQKEHDRIAGAYAGGAEGLHLFFFCAPDNCRLMATRAEAACGIRMEKIILHEIGHLLEPLLKDTIDILQEGIFDHLAELEGLLKKVSPYYLGGNEFPLLVEEAAALRTAARKNLENITVNGIEKNREAYTKKRRVEITSEIAAELLRHFYLEPCLTGKAKPPESTPWKNMNAFLAILIEEARKSLALQKKDQPLFGQSNS